MEPRALLEKAFIDPDAVDCVGWVFDEAWAKFAQVTIDSKQTPLGSPKRTWLRLS